jgi:hypothetical protein
MNNFYIWTKVVIWTILNEQFSSLNKIRNMNIFQIWTKFKIWTIFKFKQNLKSKQFSNLNKNTNSEQKRKNQKKYEENVP